MAALCAWRYASAHRRPLSRSGLTQALGVTEMTRYIEDAGFGNHILYKMCRAYPDNKDLEVIGGKLWLIGRSYAASVERKAGKNFKWLPLKKAISSSQLDSQIRACRKIKRLTEGNLHLALTAHKTLTKILKKATNLEKRSLASKYLHFHAPQAFFIYDSIAAGELRKVTKPPKGRPASSNYDKIYETFFYRCLEHRSNLEKKGNNRFSPRKLDTDLLRRHKPIKLSNT